MLDSHQFGSVPSYAHDPNRMKSEKIGRRRVRRNPEERIWSSMERRKRPLSKRGDSKTEGKDDSTVSLTNIPYEHESKAFVL